MPGRHQATRVPPASSRFYGVSLRGEVPTCARSERARRGPLRRRASHSVPIASQSAVGSPLPCPVPADEQAQPDDPPDDAAFVAPPSAPKVVAESSPGPPSANPLAAPGLLPAPPSSSVGPASAGGPASAAPVAAPPAPDLEPYSKAPMS